MGKSIDDYRAKRNFGRTPEPAPEGLDTRTPGARFVVHRHDARRLHYDLRIEMEGVLRSWAVPKGFSYDPKDKHLALRTEDHPLEYFDFHGLIPKGEYGAGSMTIWDRGRYEVLLAESPAQAVLDGELKLILRGRKLRGEWHMVKTRQEENSWLLFKSKDRYAGLARDSALGVDLDLALERDMPRSVRSMEAGGSRGAFSDPEWLFEARFEGRRLLIEKKGEQVRLRGLKRRFDGLEQAVRNVRAENALIDGVLLVQDENGRPDRERLARRLAGKSDDPLCFYAFDLLYYDEFDLRPLPLVDRKGALRAILPPSAELLFLDHVLGSGEDLLRATEAAGLRGIYAKRAGSAYRAGAHGDWQSIQAQGQAQSLDLGVAEALSKTQRHRTRNRVKYSNLDKVFWPAEGFTKGDLINYYERVADVLLPYLAERPVHLNRHPDGIEGKSFYQRQAKEGTPAWVTTELIASDTHGEAIPQIICNDRDTLMYLANLGSIDLHPWLSRRGSLDSPDWGIIDLDPKEAPFGDVVRIARETGMLLRGIGLRPLLKTSGATGLHIYVPLEPGYTYEQVRMFCEGVARVVARDLKEIATVERVIGAREGKVYVDYGQNRRGQTVVPPYVPRPVRGASVSTPLEWDELDSDLHPSKFTIQTVLRRLDERGDLFRPALDDPQDLMPAVAQLEEHLRR